MQYLSQARHYENSNIINRTKAVIHLEDKNDEVFWKPLFQKNLSKYKFNFVYHSKNQNGNSTGGCEQCLKFRPHLSSRFLIAIDSDYRYLMGEPNIDIQHFIFQTYAYSFENHFCYSSHLDEVCKCVCNFDEVTHNYNNTIFNFETFLAEYSSIVYNLFIWNVSLLKAGENSFTKDDFQSTIDIKNLKYDVASGCKSILDAVKIKVEARTKLLEAQFPTHDLELAKTNFAALGITPANTYLHIRGHDLYDTLVLIIKELANVLLTVERLLISGSPAKIKELHGRKNQDIANQFAEVFNNRLTYNIYPQIDGVSKDMATYETLYP